MPIETKRIYEPPSPRDGYRILVDRIWPRGTSRERAAIDEWARELAPGDELRRWYGHEPERFEEFSGRYRAELGAQREKLSRCDAARVQASSRSCSPPTTPNAATPPCWPTCCAADCVVTRTER